MSNFRINFSNPWLLLILVPAIALTFLPYFKINKKYRRTRNRIISVVLHTLIMVLAITTLSGIRFDYQLKNDSNEIILLVDVSNTEEQASETRDEFIKTVLKDSKYDGYKVGVVTFGYTQVYAVPLTDEVGKIYEKYKSAELPDDTATDIASALTFTKDLFENPLTSKIVLITDGKETDEKATSVIRSVAAQGTQVDTAYVPSSYDGNETQIISVEMPDSHVSIGEEFKMIVNLQSNETSDATIVVADRGVDVLEKSVKLLQGAQAVTIEYSLTNPLDDLGLHDFTFTVKPDSSYDNIEENNAYTTYLYIETYDKILVIDADAESSSSVAAIKSFLTTELPEESQYNVTVMSALDDEVPVTTDELRKYDQVILNNVKNADLKEEFVEALYSYVYDFGGGLFTVGGDRAFEQDDMINTLFQQMLPVQAIDYTPPVGVVFVIDVSGSMSATDSGTGYSRLDYAKQGMVSALGVLTQRDYVSIVTFGSDYKTVLPLTSRTQQTKIQTAIDSIEKATGGTVIPGAIRIAGQMLSTCSYVDKRHIVVITDGEVPTSEEDTYLADVDNYYKTAGTTLSVISISNTESANQRMQRLVDAGRGKLFALSDATHMSDNIRTDLQAPSIKDIVIPEGGFAPIVKNINSSLLRGVVTIDKESTDVSALKLESKLEGFNGTRARSSADVVLVGDFDVPVYAQWKYGKGSVGCFMSDLGGSWSSSYFFDKDKDGGKFIYNVIAGLMPTEDIRAKNITMTLKEDNYTNQMSVYSTLQEGQKVVGTIRAVSGDDRDTEISMNEVGTGTENAYVTLCFSKENNYSRCNFVVKGGGIYEIILKVVNADGTVVDNTTLTYFKEFSYSEEYDAFIENTDETLIADLKDLAEKGNGSYIEDLEDPHEIFKNFITDIDKTFDPRLLFAIIAIVAFLLDIAVRKFKFKWIHELIRGAKEKKN